MASLDEPDDPADTPDDESVLDDELSSDEVVDELPSDDSVDVLVLDGDVSAAALSAATCTPTRVATLSEAVKAPATNARRQRVTRLI